ncbi:hypothetical protein MKZ20_21905 [Psychrobacillus sp. FSL K6-2684]|uniref:hypothetical protein n=1 Tax=unclassified Psychrobacillus TaxID=2636677 RepID=UPI0030F5FD89
MLKKVKSTILAGAILVSLTALPFGAAADSNYNATIQPGDSTRLAQEVIWADAHLTGSQNSVYSTGNCGVNYYVTNNSGTIQDSEIVYGNKTTVTVNFDLGAIGETLTLWGKNIYNGARDAVKVIGTWFD